VFLYDAGCPLLAELRSSDSACGRLLWRKLPLKLGEAAAIYDPEQTLVSPAIVVMAA
jgi:hypothetical protein